MPFQNDILGGASGSQGVAYTIDQSMYFGDAPSSGPKLSRVFDEAGSTSPKWTFATWWKKGPVTTSAKVLYYFKALSQHAGAFVEFSHANDRPGEGAGLKNNSWPGVYNPSISWDWNTNLKDQFWDCSAWYHVCHVIDYETSPYVFLYINGVLQDINTMYSTQDGPGYGTNFSPVSGDTFYIGSNTSEQCGNAYFADTYWIEQQALNPVGTFGEFNEDTGQFVPIEYTGTYSGNSFYLDYADSADFGTDSSGLGNDFTVASIAATKQMLDTPTNNFSTMNPLGTQGTTTTSRMLEGNLWVKTNFAGSSSSTYGMESGKWYFEALPTSTSFTLGIVNDPNIRLDTTSSHVVCAFNDGGTVSTPNSTEGSDTFSSGGSGDIYGFAIDADAKTLDIYQNNTKVIEVNTFTIDAPYFLSVDRNSGITVDQKMNFGAEGSFAGTVTAQGNTDGNNNGDFYYTPPTGYLAICTQNLPDPAIALPTDHFNTVLYTGDGSSIAVTGVGFQPDFTWIKNTEALQDHTLVDVVRGATKYLVSNDTDAEVTNSAFVASFDSDGFTVGASNSSNTKQYVGWNWKAGGTGAANTDGTTNSTVSANTTAGFSIVGYTGTGSTATVGHGLSQAPEMVIVKNRTTGTTAWQVGSDTLTSWLYYITLNTNADEDTNNQMWDSTAPTASVFTVEDAGDVNTNTDNYIAYCFHSVEGYSKVGSYAGISSTNGPFVYTGFKPSYVMIKGYTAAGHWNISDSVQDPDNPVMEYIYANSTDHNTPYANWDFLSNGFKLRINDSYWNNTGNSYLYIAFAESPFKTANAR